MNWLRNFLGWYFNRKRIFSQFKLALLAAVGATLLWSFEFKFKWEQKDAPNAAAINQVEIEGKSDAEAPFGNLVVILVLVIVALYIDYEFNKEAKEITSHPNFPKELANPLSYLNGQRGPIRRFFGL